MAPHARAGGERGWVGAEFKSAGPGWEVDRETPPPPRADPHLPTSSYAFGSSPAAAANAAALPTIRPAGLPVAGRQSDSCSTACDRDETPLAIVAAWTRRKRVG